MTVLVAYGSKGGSTAEIARWVAEELQDAGYAVHLAPAAEVTQVDGYEAVVLGGSLYAAGWHADARQFAHRFAGRLAGRPVWLFSSGPLDTSADRGELPPTPQVAAAMRQLGAVGHATFGGRLSGDARGWLGFIARRLARQGRGGDFRNPERIRAWARSVGAQVPTPRTPAV